MHLFTIPAGRPFLTDLAKAILNGRLPGSLPAPDPAGLARITIYLPTVRACRALQEAFLDASRQRALLLPRIRPLAREASEPEPLLGLFAGEEAFELLPPAIGPLDRLLSLTRLVQTWLSARRRAAEDAAKRDQDTPSGFPHVTPAMAANFAKGLVRLLDQVEWSEADLSKLTELAPESFAEQWQQTLEFLTILTEAWPSYLSARGLSSPSAYERNCLDREAERLVRERSTDPIIVAGLYGGTPAGSRLMRAVANLPNGAVVLAGLDQILDDPIWKDLLPQSPSHPQYQLASLLASWGIDRSDVMTLRDTDLSPVLRDRSTVISEVMLPPAATATWHSLSQRVSGARARAAFADMTRIDVTNPEEEAEAIALILRRSAEEPQQTAAMVTPDRTLARRVAVRLQAWGLIVNDSAGSPLAKTPAGVLADLLLEAWKRNFDPASLMALLKHPLTRLGLRLEVARRGARMVELLTLRRPIVAGGLRELRMSLRRRSAALRDDDLAGHPAIDTMPMRDRELAGSVLNALTAAMAPLETLLGRDEASLPTLINAHIACLENLARDETGSSDTLWSEESGERLGELFASLQKDSPEDFSISPADFPDLLRSLIDGELIASKPESHPRIFIWGPYQSRLQRPDVVVLAGLNDGTWPQAPEPDPWLNRPMLFKLGLPLPETQIGEAAHDFVHLLAADRVYLTRSLKQEGAPTVASRWLLRLDAVLSALGASSILGAKADEPWQQWVAHRRSTTRHRPCAQPRPRPPLTARPRRMSVTRIEPWMANPYSVFARDILGLRPMPALGGEPEASLRGRLIHKALGELTARHPSGPMPLDAARQLAELAATALRDYVAHPQVIAFWAPRFRRFAEWFTATEDARRVNAERIVAEVTGSLTLLAPAGPFRLTARADRIDVLRDRSLAITDYKTGAPPKDLRVLEGLSPQLPLEAAIASRGGFVGLAESRVSLLRYIQARGGEPPGTESALDVASVEDCAEAATSNLLRLVALFDDPATPYTPTRRPQFKSIDRFDDYAHLARFDEWARGGDIDD
jgi:ATP-dependent helicase/nuclease subunit B